MNVPRTLIATLLFAGCLASLYGCVALPHSGDASVDETGVTPVDLDDHDYKVAVAEFASDMLTWGFPMDYVVVLGPVDIRGCKDALNVQTLHQALQATYKRYNLLTFLTAEAATSDNRPAAETYKIIESKWAEGTPIDVQTYQDFGNLANVNAIVLCRVSVTEGETRSAAGARQATCRFAWKMANTQTGNYDVSREEKISKPIRPRTK